MLKQKYLLVIILLLLTGQTSASWSVAPEIKQGIYAHYEKATKQLMENEKVPQKDKQKIIFTEFNDFVVCVTLREYLQAKYPENTKFANERNQLAGHMDVLVQVMEDLGLVTKDDLMATISRDKPQLAQSIKGVYERSSNNGKKQASDELYGLVRKCDKRVSSIKRIENGASQK